MSSETVETFARTTPDGLLNLSLHVSVADADVAVSVRVTPLSPSGDLDPNGWPRGYFDQVAGSMPNLERAPQGFISESNVQDALNEVQSVLAQRLHLQSPRFALESSGSKVSGSIISPSFRGMRDSERQRRVWDALQAEYGAQSVERVGTLLAFTPDEWDLGGDIDAD